MLRLSTGGRASGTIKGAAEDFKVEEITQQGHVLEIGKKYTHDELGIEQKEGKFAVFVMQKTNWNTIQALKAVARRFRRGVKSTGFAGTKDRTSVSTQLCSIFGVKPEELSQFHMKDISINGAWSGGSKVEMGSLIGNRFGISVKDPSNFDGLQSIESELGGVFPNYFGEQRFGYRNINVEVGTDILKGDFKGAALRFLTDTQNETNEDANAARNRLAEEMDFSQAMQYFPGYLKYERSMIEYLAKYPNNYANSIRKLPRAISLMFIHSVEARIFNKVLEERITNKELATGPGDIVCQENFYGFPDISNVSKFEDSNGKFTVGSIIGYDTKSITELERQALDELGLTIESFKVKGLEELNAKGTYRVLFAPYKDISHNYNQKQQTLEIGFSLPAGSYATILMDELVEVAKIHDTEA
ncbi:MAG: tRNA pseudouridine(13) synthase TruD [Candidatus Micrarchaeaceae archaeon]|jgi:tRNA pseudouridine13 synthase